jgi:hypothetical protein
MAASEQTANVLTTPTIGANEKVLGGAPEGAKVK